MALQEHQIQDYIFRSREHLLTMLEDRGFNIDNYKSYTKEELIESYKLNTKFTNINDVGPLDIIVENNNKHKIYVKYKNEKFKKTKSIEQQILDIYKTQLKKNDTLIFIVHNKILFKQNKKDSNAELFVDDWWSKYNYFIQIFGLENLLFNISKHKYVPKHRIITEEERKKLLELYKVTNIKNIPLIRREDPPAKYAGIKPMDICKIDAPSISNINSIKYRLCM